MLKIKNDAFHVMKTSSHLAWRANPGMYICCIVLSAISAVNTYLNLSFIENNVNASYEILKGTAHLQEVIRRLWLYTIAFVVLILLKMCLQLTEKRLVLDVSYQFEKELNEHLSHIEWEYYENHDTYVKTYQVRKKTLDTIIKMIHILLFYCNTIPLIVVYAYFLARINVFVVIGYMILLLILNKKGTMLRDEVGVLWKNVQPISQKKDYYFDICGDKIFHQEYKFYRLYDYIQDKWEKLHEQEHKAKMSIYKKVEKNVKLAQLYFYIPRFLLLIYITVNIIQGKNQIGFFIMANNLLNNISTTLMQVQKSVIDANTSYVFIETYEELMQWKEKTEVPVVAQDTDISLQDITYEYPQSQRKVLNHLNLMIEHGKKIAIVGENGSGKTTTMNLLLSLTDRYDGWIEGLSSHKVTAISQDFAQYQMTIFDNITIGNLDKKFTEEEILQLLDAVGLKDMVQKLEHGVWTQLGQIDNGIGLSKGQWQRLAIARLLANPDADVWILDEPTAYLDPISEIQIYDMIYKLSGTRTVLFISHRLGFAKKADYIVVFKDGQVSEIGNHKMLMSKNGIYAKMYTAQEEWYIS